MLEFYSVNKTKRPVRLCEKTRQFAYDSLHYKYGQDTVKNNSVDIDGMECLGDNPTDLDKYDAAIEKIAAEAPIRICDGELLSGAATLGQAIWHTVPAKYKGEIAAPSVSHLTVDFQKVIRVGWLGIEKEVEESLKVHTEEREVRFLESCRRCINAFKVWHQRYLDALKDMPEYKDNYQNLCRVPLLPPENYYEAVQSIWFTFAFLRLCGNWPGIGRIDEMLEPFLQKDLKEGKITIERAREILAHFFIKGCEWIRGGDCGSGDAQHYQNLVLSGINEKGEDVTGDVTYLVLDVIEELGISDFPTTVRINSKTDDKLVKRVSEVIRYGGGIIAIYNEDLILKALTDFGYDPIAARNFANDGCWEVQIPGQTCFSYSPFDGLQILQKITLKGYAEDLPFNSFEELYSQFEKDFDSWLTNWAGAITNHFSEYDENTKTWKRRPSYPCTVVSLWEEGCIRNARSYSEGGANYNVQSPHIGGLPDVANSLYAIKKLVFDEKKITLNDFMKVLRDDWQGHEELRQYARTRYKYFGNDNDEVDEIACRILQKFAEVCARETKGKLVKMPSGVSTFGRQIEWAPERMSVPHGFVKGKYLAGNLSPTPGTDTEGATAIIKSYCKCDLAKQTTGAALDISLLPSSVKGDDGLDALSGLIRGFVALGGFFMQIDVTDAEVLKCAQERPEDYPTLSVRVSGWNARFVTLNREWQNMVIERDSK